MEVIDVMQPIVADKAPGKIPCKNVDNCAPKTRPRKLVFASCCYQPYMRGGGEVANQRLVQALKLAGYDITVISIGDKDCRDIVDGISVIRLRSANVHWLYRSKDSPKPIKALWHVLDAMNWMIAHRIGELLDELQPDCLITSTVEDISTFTWREAKRRGIRTIDMLHSYYLLCYSGAMFRNGKNCNGQCAGCSILCYPKKLNSAYVDDVIGVSEYVLNKHIASGLFTQSRKHVIPNIGFDHADAAAIERGAAAIERGAAAIERKGPASKRLRIGFLGRLHPTKGIHHIIEAIVRSTLAERFHLIIAGEGDAAYKQELQQLSVRQNVSLQFLGHVPPPQLFSQIDYLIVPSVWQEPFGLVLTEAARAGIPVIAARAGGMPEIVSSDMGLCFSGIDELSSLLSRLLHERPHFSFGSLHRFEKQNIINQWRALLEAVPVRGE